MELVAERGAVLLGLHVRLQALHGQLLFQHASLCMMVWVGQTGISSSVWDILSLVHLCMELDAQGGAVLLVLKIRSQALHCQRPLLHGALQESHAGGHERNE